MSLLNAFTQNYFGLHEDITRAANTRTWQVKSGHHRVPAMHRYRDTVVTCKSQRFARTSICPSNPEDSADPPVSLKSLTLLDEREHDGQIRNMKVRGRLLWGVTEWPPPCQAKTCRHIIASSRNVSVRLLPPPPWGRGGGGSLETKKVIQPYH